MKGYWNSLDIEFNWHCLLWPVQNDQADKCIQQFLKLGPVECSRF